MPAIIRCATVAALAACCCGCVMLHSYRKGEPVDQAALEKLQIGQANTVVVENNLGLPDEIISVGNGMIYRYDYSKINTFLFFVIGHSSQHDDKLFMLFDDRGIRADKKYQDKTKDTGWRLWPFGR